MLPSNLRVAIIRDAPLLTASTGIISSELIRHLKGRVAVEDVFCGSRKKSRQIQGEEPEEIVSYGPKLFKYRQLSFRMPKYDIYHFQSHKFIEVAQYKKLSIVTVLDLRYFKGKELYGKDYHIHRSEIRPFKRLSRIDKLIAISRYTKDDVVKLLGISPRKISVVPLGVNHGIYKPRDKVEMRRKLGLPEDKLILLNVGSENECKNIHRLMRVFQRLQRKFKDLILLRVGKREEEITGLIDRLGIADKVIRLGERSLPKDCYNAADALVCISLADGFGMPNLEAMASGCPVVCSNDAAFPEVVGDAALLVNPFDEDDIYEKVAALVSDKTLRHEYGCRGLERAKSFSWEKTAEETLKVYWEVAGV